jgi:hypothetical protein
MPLAGIARPIFVSSTPKHDYHSIMQPHRIHHTCPVPILVAVAVATLSLASLAQGQCCQEKGVCCMSNTKCPTTQPSEGVASDSAVSVEDTATAGSRKPPFMFHEAKLPEGFPQPGPTGQVVFKRYPAYRAAWATVPTAKESNSNSLFGSLFKHIQRNKIAMTAPVEMGYDRDSTTAGPVSMAFMYADTRMGKLGNDQGVQVKDNPAVDVLSVTVRGSYSSKTYEAAVTQLKAHAAEHAQLYEVAGSPRVLGYNSPFVPWFLRVSEVQLPVIRRDSQQ